MNIRQDLLPDEANYIKTINVRLNSIDIDNVASYSKIILYKAEAEWIL
jgi:hypothetical protein